MHAVADLEICKGGFGLHIHSAPPQSREVAISPRKARKFFLRVLFSD